MMSSTHWTNVKGVVLVVVGIAATRADSARAARA